MNLIFRADEELSGQEPPLKPCWVKYNLIGKCSECMTEGRFSRQLWLPRPGPIKLQLGPSVRLKGWTPRVMPGHKLSQWEMDMARC